MQRVDLRDQHGDLRRDLLHVVMLIRYLSGYLLHTGLLIHDALSQRSQRNRILVKKS